MQQRTNDLKLLKRKHEIHKISEYPKITISKQKMESNINEIFQWKKHKDAVLNSQRMEKRMHDQILLEGNMRSRPKLNSMSLSLAIGK